MEPGTRRLCGGQNFCHTISDFHHVISCPNRQGTAPAPGVVNRLHTTARHRPLLRDRSAVFPRSAVLAPRLSASPATCLHSIPSYSKPFHRGIYAFKFPLSALGPWPLALGPWPLDFGLWVSDFGHSVSESACSCSSFPVCFQSLSEFRAPSSEFK